jgi:predicted transposase YdaD
MRESIIYQEIEAQGLQRGLQQGRQEGILEGDRSLILRQLTRRFGELPAELSTQVEALSLPQLEALADALLDFSELTDLVDLLQKSAYCLW